MNAETLHDIAMTDDFILPVAEDFRTEFKRDVSSSDLERKVVAFLNSPD